MNVISFSNSKFNKLNLLDLDKSVFNTEAQIYNYSYKNNAKVLKKLYNTESGVFANKLYTVEKLDEAREMLPSSFCIPDNLVVVGGRIIGFTLPKVDGENLNLLLANKKIDLKDKLYYLKKVGEVLQQMDYLRKNPQLKNFYLNDLHDSNIMVNPVNGDISIIDLDSAKIGKDTFFGARFLSSKALLNNTRGKYNIIDQVQNSYLHSSAYVDADRNTDLYCYTIMILNFLYKNYINNLSLEEYYEYLNYLESIGLNKELVDAFYCIVSNEENKNPSSYLESIDYKQLFMASKGEFVKKLKK